jgi:hypothetical protein
METAIRAAFGRFQQHLATPNHLRWSRPWSHHLVQNLLYLVRKINNVLFHPAAYRSGNDFTEDVLASISKRQKGVWTLIIVRKWIVLQEGDQSAKPKAHDRKGDGLAAKQGPGTRDVDLNGIDNRRFFPGHLAGHSEVMVVHGTLKDIYE